MGFSAAWVGALIGWVGAVVGVTGLAQAAKTITATSKTLKTKNNRRIGGFVEIIGVSEGALKHLRAHIITQALAPGQKLNEIDPRTDFTCQPLIRLIADKTMAVRSQ